MDPRGCVEAHLAGVLYRSTRAAAFSPLTPRTCISCRAKTSLTDWAWGQGGLCQGQSAARPWEELGKGTTLFLMAPALKSLKVRSEQRGFGEGPAPDSGSPGIPQGRLHSVWP